MNDILKIVQALEDSNILIKRITKTIENETKEQKDGFLSMLSGTLRAILLGTLLAGKGIVRAGYGFLITQVLTNFEIQRYYQNEARFNGVCSRDKLSKTIKNGAYLIFMNMQMLLQIRFLCM